MKNARQQKILELIEKYDIDTQDTLIRKLGEEVCQRLYCGIRLPVWLPIGCGWLCYLVKFLGILLKCCLVLFSANYH